MATRVTMSELAERRAPLLRLKLVNLKRACKKEKLSQQGGKFDLVERLLAKLYVVCHEDHLGAVQGFIRGEVSIHGNSPREMIALILRFYANPVVMRVHYCRHAPHELMVSTLDEWRSVLRRIMRCFCVEIKSPLVMFAYSKIVTDKMWPHLTWTQHQDFFLRDKEEVEEEVELLQKMRLFELVARFLRTVPPASRLICSIWKHCVKTKMDDGKSQVLDRTESVEHITRLLCDCVMVYIKDPGMNYQYDPGWPKNVKWFVLPAAAFMFDKYHPLQRSEFENGKTYFAEMLQDYVVEGRQDEENQ